MTNARRRKRRKNPSRTRRQSSKRAVQALAAGAAIAAGTQAYADPIRFDNLPGAGHFAWADPGAGVPIELDVTLPAASQPGDDGLTCLGQSVTPTMSGLAGAVDVEAGGPYGLFAIGVGAGELIPSGAPWSDGNVYIYYPGLGSQLPEGQETYLAGRFDLGGGYQYAWIGVVRTGLELDAFAWGYETEAGVPIPAGFPEPGTLAALALGAAAALTSRRRFRSQID